MNLFVDDDYLEPQEDDPIFHSPDQNASTDIYQLLLVFVFSLTHHWLFHSIHFFDELSIVHIEILNYQSNQLHPRHLLL